MAHRVMAGLSVLAACAGCGGRPPAEHSAAAQVDDDEPIDPQASPTGILLGQVRDLADGASVPFAAIAAEPVAVDGATGRRAIDVSGEGGAFRLRLPAGRYRVIATYGGLVAEVPDVLVLASSATRIHIDLDSRAPRLPMTGSSAAPSVHTGEIAGRVLDSEAAAPFPGAVVAVSSPDLSSAQMALADHRGRYRVRGLPPGRYVVTVYYQLIDRGAIELRRTGVEVTPGRVTRIDLALDLRVHH